MLVIGLDGASLELIKTWSFQGKLPAFTYILKKGVGGKLRSVIPPITPSAWSSFITGKNPGKHGIFGFVNRNSELVNASHIDGPTLWRLLSAHQKKVFAMNVPMTFPPEKVNGALISGYMAPPDDVYAFPEKIKKELLTRFPTYRVYMKEHDVISKNEESMEAWLRDLWELTNIQAEAMLYFLKHFEWDFFMTVFMGTDWISHSLWRYMDPRCPSYDPEMARKYGGTILRYYQRIDSIMRNVLDKLDEGTSLFVVSDHGNRAFYRNFVLQDWLHNMGLLKFRISDPRNAAFWLSITRANVEKILTVLSKHPGILKTIRRTLSVFHLESSIVMSVNWKRTKVWPAESSQYGLCINLKGRERYGLVEPGREYEQLREFIIDNLNAYEDPFCGQHAFEVFRREEVYSGPYIHEAPDLLLLERGFLRLSRGLVVPLPILHLAKEFVPTAFQSSRHDIEGVFLAFGNEIKENVEFEGANIYDLAPTILHMLNVPIPSDMDGRILSSIFKPSSLLARKKVNIEPVVSMKKKKYDMTEEEKRKVKKRLEALGYFD